MSMESIYGIEVQKHNYLPYGSCLKTPCGIIASRDVFVNRCYYIDKSKESIYAYWFKARGVNDESVDDCIAVAIAKIHKDIDFHFEVMKTLEYYSKDIFVVK